MINPNLTLLLKFFFCRCVECNGNCYLSIPGKFALKIAENLGGHPKKDLPFGGKQDVPANKKGHPKGALPFDGIRDVETNKISGAKTDDSVQRSISSSKIVCDTSSVSVENGDVPFPGKQDPENEYTVEDDWLVTRYQFCSS